MSVATRVATALAWLAAACASQIAAAAALRFSVPEGRVLNEFYREGPVAAHMVRTRSHLGAVITAADAVRGSELWSWSHVDGRYRVEPFGQRQEDETESNAAQLWSTVYLARPLW